MKTHTLVAWAAGPGPLYGSVAGRGGWTKGHVVLSDDLAWADFDFCAGIPTRLKTRCGLRVPLPAAGPLYGDLFTTVYYTEDVDRLGVCERCGTKGTIHENTGGVR